MKKLFIRVRILSEENIRRTVWSKKEIEERWKKMG